MWFHLCTGNHDPTGKDSLYDMIQWLSAGLTSLRHKVTVGDSIASNAVNILWENFRDQDERLFAENDFIFGLIATEIPTDHTFNWIADAPWVERRRAFDKIAPRAQFIWSMVEAPVKSYAEMALSGYLELGYSEQLLDPVFANEPQADFGFYGLVTPYRREIMTRLRDHCEVIVPNHFLKGTELNRFISSFKVGICFKQSQLWPIPSPTRVGRLLHAKRGVAMEFVPERTRQGALVPMVSNDQDFAEFCLECIAGPWKRKAEEAFDKFKQVMPMTQIVEKLLDTTLKSRSSGQLTKLATSDNHVRDELPFTAPRQPRLLENRDGYNLVSIDGRVCAINRTLGAIDLSSGLEDLTERYAPADFIVTESVGDARARVDMLVLGRRMAKLEAEYAALVAKNGNNEVEFLGSVDNFNIIRHGRNFFAIHQSLGEVDVALGPEVLGKRYEPETFFVTDSEAAARTRLDVLRLLRQIADLGKNSTETPARKIDRLVEETTDYNIVQAGDQFLAVAKSLGATDLFLERLGQREIGSSILIGSSLDDVRARAKEAEEKERAAAIPTIKLIEQTAHYSLIQAGDRFLAVAKSLGPADLFFERLGDRELGDLLLAGSSLDEVRGRAQEVEEKERAAAVPTVTLIEQTADYSLIQAGDRFLAVAKALGPIELFRERLGERELGDLLLIGSSLEDVRTQAELQSRMKFASRLRKQAGSGS